MEKTGNPAFGFNKQEQNNINLNELMLRETGKNTGDGYLDEGRINLFPKDFFKNRSYKSEGRVYLGKESNREYCIVDEKEINEKLVAAIIRYVENNRGVVNTTGEHPGGGMRFPEVVENSKVNCVSIYDKESNKAVFSTSNLEFEKFASERSNKAEIDIKKPSLEFKSIESVEYISPENISIMVRTSSGEVIKVIYNGSLNKPESGSK